MSLREMCDNIIQLRLLLKYYIRSLAVLYKICCNCILGITVIVIILIIR